MASSLSPRAAELLKIARRLPWDRLGFLTAVVTLGLSQIVFNVVQENLDFYPRGSWFFASVVLLVQIVPLAFLVLLEVGLLRWRGTGRSFTAWRAALLTLLFFSLLRQVQVYYPAPFWALMAWVPLRPALFALTILVFLISFRFMPAIKRYFSWLGALSLVSTAVFIAHSDAFDFLRSRGESRPIQTSREELPPVVMIVFDELSQDVLEKDGAVDPERFPNFSALSKEGAWFTNATANHYSTTEAFPALLTGFIYPPDDVPTLFDRIPRDYEVLLRLGSTASYNWIRRRSRDRQKFTVYSWSEKIIGSPFEVPRYLYLTFSQTPFLQSPFDGHHAVRLAPPIMWLGTGFEVNLKKDIEEFLADLSSPDARPRFLFWHCFLPHFPFLYDAQGKLGDSPNRSFSRAPGSVDSSVVYRTSTNKPDASTGYSPEGVYERYRGQVQFVDRIVGRVVARLKKEGLYEKCILVITSDHGLRTWGEMEPEGYPRLISNHTPGIPLFIRAPGVTPGADPRDVQQIDLLPTLVELLGGTNRPGDTEGLSALAEERPAREKIFVNAFIGLTPRRYRYDAVSGLWKRTD